MSHITECKLNVQICDEKTLKSALKLMEKEGYKILTTDKGYAIDLTSKGLKHAYHSQGTKWSQIQLEKTTNKEGKPVFIAKGDAYSIREGYETAIKTLEKSYTVAGLTQALAAAGYMAPTVKTEEKTTYKSIGKTVIRAMRY